MRKIYIPLLLAVVSAEASLSFYYNQAGYDSDGRGNLVVYSSEELEGAEWLIMKSSDGGAYSVERGTFTAGINPDNWLSSGKYYTVSLPSTLQEGEYYLSTTEGGAPWSEVVPSNSGKFEISAGELKAKTLGPVLGYFRSDRSSATSHTYVYVGTYASAGVDVHGGWNDASGDYGTYLSHLSYANYMNPQQIPLTVWALAFANERIPAAVESATSDAEFAVDEALWGADFLVRMQNEAGYFYMTVFNQWGQSSSWHLCAFSGSGGEMSNNYQTAYREGGGMAIAALARASTLGKDGSYTAEKYLEVAKAGFEHLESKQTLGGECSYCDDGVENIIDDYAALLAATELAMATGGKSQYLNVARDRAEHLVGRLSDDGYFWSDNAKTRPFYHASDAGLPVVALLRYLELENSFDYEACPPEWDCSINPSEHMISLVTAAVKKHLNWMVNVTDRANNPFGYAKQVVKTGGAIQTNFFIPHDNETGYWFQGENARLGSLAAAAVYASRMLGYADSAKAFQYAADQLDWILGKNPYGLSFMEGVGTKNSTRYQSYSNTKGGIANGITGKNMDGSGITWDNVSDIASQLSSLGESAADWQTWRWEEQWLPHATWYLMALATRYDEHPTKVIFPTSSSSSQGGNSSSSSQTGGSSSSSAGNTSVSSSSGDSDTDIEDIDEKSSSSRSRGRRNTDGVYQIASVAGFSVLQSGNTLQVTFANPDQRKFHLMDVHGRVVMNTVLSNASNTVQLSTLPKGIYLVHVQGFAPKKIVVK